jgi:hypothetical protein
VSDQTVVLYIAGSGRSGSTLLANILGQVNGFFAVGELSNVWQRSLIEDRLCGCDVRFRQCTLWRQIIERMSGNETIDPAAMIAAQRSLIRVRHVPSMLLRSPRRGLSAGEYGHRLSRLYTAIREVTGCQIIVDSSKQPTYGRVLEALGSLKLFVVHLIRDPRASAYSWLRRKVQPDRGYFGYMQQQTPLRSAALWTIWNTTATVLWRSSPDRYFQLRYEDFTAHPREAVARILKFVGHEGALIPFTNERTVRLKQTHSVSGNPNRLNTGTITISPDVEWTAGLGWQQRALVTLVALPLLRRFGYPLLPTSTPSSLPSAADSQDCSVPSGPNDPW